MADVTIIGLFDSRADAERAAERLRRELDPPPQDIALHVAAPEAEAWPPAVRLSALPPEDQALYREGLRRGGIPLAVATSGVMVARVVAIFGECGAADLEAREATYRAEGWTGKGAETGYTDHDEDIGYATYGGDAVIRPIPRRHHDDMPAGLLGRLEMAAMPDAPEVGSRQARCYVARDPAAP